MKRFTSILGLGSAVAFFDQWTKWWTMNHFQLGDTQPLTPFFSLTLVFNTGSAFGLFAGNNRALLVLAFMILGMLLYGARGFTERGGTWAAVGVALIFGGAVGNIIDRFRFGRVVDFLDFHFWPVFNVADSAICVGAGLLMLALWKDP